MIVWTWQLKKKCKQRADVKKSKQTFCVLHQKTVPVADVNVDETVHELAKNSTAAVEVLDQCSSELTNFDDVAVEDGFGAEDEIDLFPYYWNDRTYWKPQWPH